MAYHALHVTRRMSKSRTGQRFKKKKKKKKGKRRRKKRESKRENKRREMIKRRERLKAYLSMKDKI